MGFAQDQRIVGEARILPGIAHLHQIVAQHDMRAERGAIGAFLGIGADAGKEPEPVMLQQADQGDGRIAQARGEIDQGPQLRIVFQRFEMVGLVNPVATILADRRVGARPSGPNLCRHSSQQQPSTSRFKPSGPC